MRGAISDDRPYRDKDRSGQPPSERAPEEQRVAKVVHADVNVAGMRGENGEVSNCLEPET